MQRVGEGGVGRAPTTKRKLNNAEINKQFGLEFFMRLEDYSV